MFRARVFAVLFGIFVCFLIGGTAFGLAQEEFGNKDVEVNSEWPKGTAELVQLPSRIYWSWVNGDENFYFKGETDEFNEFLKMFVKVDAPVHKLIFLKQFNQESSLDGRTSFRYDWKLSVPSGLYLSSIKSEGVEDANQLYPSVKISVHSDNIGFDKIVLPEGLEFVFPEAGSSDLVRLRITQFESVRKWNAAFAKWEKFIQPYLEDIREQEKDPSRQCVQIKSSLISDYLPRHKIFVLETSLINKNSIFALSIDGEITELSSGRWSLDQQAGYYFNPNISDFLKDQNLKIQDSNYAVSVAKLVEEISNAAEKVMLLKSDTEDFRIFDKRIYRSVLCKELDWKYTAEKKGNIWKIKQDYVGPPASIEAQPSWELVVDEQDRLIQVRF